MVAEIWQFRDLIRRLILRGVQGQFRQSFLGYLWIVLPPIGTTLVFGLLREANVLAISDKPGGLPYTLFVLLGSTFWGYFTQLVIATSSSISNAGALVSKIYFPREVLAVSSCGNAVINLLIRLIVVAITCVLIGFVPAWQALYALLIAVPMTAMGLGIGLLLAPIQTMTTDVGRGLELLFQFGMFMAPTVYPTPALSPDGGWTNALYWVHQLNPFSHFLYAIHGVFLNGAISNVAGFNIACALSAAVLLLGWRFFDICEPFLAERL
ncbi:MAG: ABC transporter permease [Kiritimatiellae bacterium]|nr:ABC transporter permease [Kiritimatiellia bacterium]MCO6400572.1 ABC transporter permease [Verrucomicrobiota bacterium]